VRDAGTVSESRDRNKKGPMQAPALFLPLLMTEHRAFAARIRHRVPRVFRSGKTQLGRLLLFFLFLLLLRHGVSSSDRQVEKMRGPTKWAVLIAPLPFWPTAFPPRRKQISRVWLLCA
jgi:hypothetical protein